jgi:OOP family OmpA-OmpF porin
VIDDFGNKEFDEFDLIVGKCKPDPPGCQTQHLEGKIDWVEYTTPPNRSLLEIIRNYQQGLQKAGFKQIFACHEKDCGTNGEGNSHTDQLGFINGWNNRYWVGKLARPTGDVYAAVNADGPDDGNRENGTHVLTIELKPMEGGLVSVTAAELADELATTGHSALYGIYFDTGKAEVKPESDAALAEVTKLLQNKTLKLIVAGHTDNVGDFASNMDLSKRRAQAVVQALVKRGVAASRLNPQGLGPCAPVASNDDDAGRAKNRRVELVKQ